MSKATLDALNDAIRDHMQDTADQPDSIILNWGVVYEHMTPSGKFANGYALSEHITPSAAIGIGAILMGSLDNDLLETDTDR